MTDKPKRRISTDPDSTVIELNTAGDRRGMHRRGNGAGWGGPARGPSTAPRFSASNQPTPEAKRGGWQSAIADRIEALELYTAIMRDDAQPGAVRIAAADKLLDRLEGKPVARAINVSSDDIDALSDEQLMEIIQRGKDEPVH